MPPEEPRSIRAVCEERDALAGVTPATRIAPRRLMERACSVGNYLAPLEDERRTVEVAMRPDDVDDGEDHHVLELTMRLCLQHITAEASLGLSARSV